MKPFVNKIFTLWQPSPYTYFRGEGAYVLFHNWSGSFLDALAIAFRGY